MKTIKLEHDIFNELHILTKEEYKHIDNDYKGRSLIDKTIKCAFLPGHGTTLFYENMHFLIVDTKKPVKKYAIWKDHKVIGYCDITKEAAEKANCANNAIFYFGFDKVTDPSKYSL